MRTISAVRAVLSAPQVRHNTPEAVELEWRVSSLGVVAGRRASRWSYSPRCRRRLCVDEYRTGVPAKLVDSYRHHAMGCDVLLHWFGGVHDGRPLGSID